MIRGYAQKFIVDILELLDNVPRQMLLLFKMNDCLRHIDHALGSPSNTLVTAGTFAARAVREAEIRRITSVVGKKNENVRGLDLRKRLQSWLSYKKLMVKISLYEWMCWVQRGRGNE